MSQTLRVTVSNNVHKLQYLQQVSETCTDHKDETTLVLQVDVFITCDHNNLMCD